MSLFNGFELVTFMYRKELTAFLSYIRCSSFEGSSTLYDIGKVLLDEKRMSLPEIHYKRKNDPDKIMYYGQYMA